MPIRPQDYATAEFRRPATIRALVAPATQAINAEVSFPSRDRAYIRVGDWRAGGAGRNIPINAIMLRGIPYHASAVFRRGPDGLWHQFRSAEVSRVDRRDRRPSQSAVRQIGMMLSAAFHDVLRRNPDAPEQAHDRHLQEERRLRLRAIYERQQAIRRLWDQIVEIARDLPPEVRAELDLSDEGVEPLDGDFWPIAWS